MVYPASLTGSECKHSAFSLVAKGSNLEPNFTRPGLHYKPDKKTTRQNVCMANDNPEKLKCGYGLMDRPGCQLETTFSLFSQSQPIFQILSGFWGEFDNIALFQTEGHASPVYAFTRLSLIVDKLRGAHQKAYGVLT